MFTSYAQNFEDVMLWRALKHVENGFYIDIGAQDPIIDSVSRGFYEKGWFGVSVEPTSTYATKLRADRTNEDIQQCAVGTGSGEIRFFEFPDTGLSTGVEDHARSHRDRGFRDEVTTVRLVPLSEILDRHPDRDIHWLKIDVEGMEDSVLESWGDNPRRPWLVVVESTKPMSTEQSHPWEHMLTERGYERCYFDGLNSFYVASHKSELKDAFRIPPNVFDEFTLSGTATSNITSSLARKVEAATHDLHAQKNRLQDREKELAELTINFDNATNALRFSEEAIKRIHASFSWRVTRPYRCISRIAKRAARRLILVARRFQKLPKRILRSIVLRLISLVKSSPRFRSFALRAVHKHHRVLSPFMSLARSRNLIGIPHFTTIGSVDDEMGRYPTRSFDITTEDRSGLSREGSLALSRLSLVVRRD